MKLTHLTPVLNVSDVPASLEWFEALGRPVWMSWVLSSIEELDATHARARELGYEISMEPTDESWGMREFHLRHPDGHTFRVSAERG